MPPGVPELHTDPQTAEWFTVTSDLHLLQGKKIKEEFHPGGSDLQSSVLVEFLPSEKGLAVGRELVCSLLGPPGPV